MTRRRIEPLGRAALQVAFWAQDDLDEAAVSAMPLVFASRWGEWERSQALLQALGRSEALSPTSFSHSVHNAVGALYSIQRHITANVAAVAAREHSLEAGWVEAAGLIAEGAPEVMLVLFDAPLPAPYESTRHPLECTRALALRLRRALAGEQGIHLAAVRAPLQEALGTLPHDLATLRYLLSTPAAGSKWQSGPWLWSRP